MQFPQFDDWVPNKYWQQQQHARASRTLQKAHTLRALFSFSLPQSGLSGFPCLFNAFRIEMPQLRQGSITCRVQCAENQIIRESAGQKPSIQSETYAVLTTGARVLLCLCLAIILTSPLQGRFLSSSTLTLCPDAACSIDGLNPAIRTKKMSILLISRGVRAARRVSATNSAK